MRQVAGKEYKDYLVHVEGLSRDCELGFSKNAFGSYEIKRLRAA